MPAQTFDADALASADHGARELGTQCASIRLGLLVDDEFLPEWAGELIEELHRNPAVELVIVVRCTGFEISQWPPKSTLFRLWSKLDEWIFQDKSDHLPPVLGAYETKTVRFDRDKTGKLEPFGDDVTRIRAHQLDVLVQLGSSQVTPLMSSCARHGIWSFHYDGRSSDEIGAAFFWNLYDGKPCSELVLASVTGEQRLLYRCNFSNDLISLRRNLVQDYRRRSRILLRCISEVSRRGWSGIGARTAESTSTSTTIQSQRGSVREVMPRFIARWVISALGRLWARFGFYEQWFVAYAKADVPNLQRDPSNTGSDRLMLLKPARGENYADPFLFERNGKTYLFFEEYRNGQPGVICCAEFKNDGTLSRPQMVLARNYHLSYPSVFEWQGQIYMLTETQENRTVEIYASVEFPNRWELASVLFHNVSVVDPTVFQHNGKLWLFVAGLAGEGSESTELSLFSADSLFGQWQSHPKNPIVCDVRRARPAGSLFFHQGSLIRPAQDCALRYGHAIALNRVDKLSETDYRETLIDTILPNWMDGICATHTLNRLGDFTVLDGRALVPRLSIFSGASRFRMSRAWERSNSGIQQ